MFVAVNDLNAGEFWKLCKGDSYSKVTKKSFHDKQQAASFTSLLPLFEAACNKPVIPSLDNQLATSLSQLAQVCRQQAVTRHANASW